jgi:hypothetical protein
MKETKSGQIANNPEILPKQAEVVAPGVEITTEAVKRKAGELEASISDAVRKAETMPLYQKALIEKGGGSIGVVKDKISLIVGRIKEVGESSKALINKVLIGAGIVSVFSAGEAKGQENQNNVDPDSKPKTEISKVPNPDSIKIPLEQIDHYANELLGATYNGGIFGKDWVSTSGISAPEVGSPYNSPTLETERAGYYISFTKNGKEYVLTPGEYKLFEETQRQRNRILSGSSFINPGRRLKTRDEILEDRKFPAKSRFIDSLKLNTDSDEPFDSIIKKSGKEEEFKIFFDEYNKKKDIEMEKMIKEKIARDKRIYLCKAMEDRLTRPVFEMLGIVYDDKNKSFLKDGVIISTDLALRLARGLVNNNFKRDGGAFIAYSKVRAAQIDSIDVEYLTEGELANKINRIPYNEDTKINLFDIPKFYENKRESANFSKQRRWLYDWFTDPATLKRAAQMGIDPSEFRGAIERIASNSYLYTVDPDILDMNTTGLINESGSIIVADDNNPFVQIHELTHRTWVSEFPEEVKDIINKIVVGDNPELREFLKKRDNEGRLLAYQYSEDEIVARLMTMRYKYKLKPGQRVTLRMLKDYNPDDYFGMNKNEMVFLLNLVVSNEKPLPKATIPYEDASADLIAKNIANDDKARSAERDALNKGIMRDLKDRINNPNNDVKS